MAQPLPILDNKQQWKNKRIGLFGGSFNPPHKGHAHVAQMALTYLQLDCIWWLVTPQNPLKTNAPPPIEERIQQCQDLINSPQMIVTDIEQHLNTYSTYETVTEIKTALPDAEFIWINGMDNALSFHKWKNWQELLGEISFFYLTRPPADTEITSTPLYMLETQENIHINAPSQYDLSTNKTYWLLDVPSSDLSSTKIRRQQKDS